MKSPTPTKHVFVTGGVASSLGKGLTASSLGQLLKSRGLRVTMQKLDPYLNVDPGHDEPLPARRGLRDQRRCGDRSRHRSLRAVPRHRPQPDRQRHDGAGLLHRHRQGAPRRLPRRHRAGDPAHHQRDQGPHPRDGRSRHRRGHHRDRRHGRRHRVAALPRGCAPDAPPDRSRQLLLHPRLAGSLHRTLRRAEDQAHPALGGGAALDRYPARRHRLPCRSRAARQHQAQDRADVRRRRRGRGHRCGRPVDL